jgi:hypothetical protein
MTDPSHHRSFTAKIAKSAKNIAKTTALLSRRAIAYSIASSRRRNHEVTKAQRV